MGFVVAVERRFKARQGLGAPARERAGLALLGPGEKVEVTLRLGVSFADEQLDEKGRFFDTDELGSRLDEVVAELQSATWTRLFPFRPTFELVARELYRRLAPVSFVELRDETFGSSTRYSV